MRALADHFALVEHDDAVRVADGADPLRHYQRSRVARLLFERRTEYLIRLIIERGKGIVENVYFGTTVDSPRDGKTLFLPARQDRKSVV